ncbi:MAG: sulfatase-like hydrolase/transferase, partial [Firmicutes bacterium]|nr:sulfatase-like hydrolase/transferase [Bacillota bacterium]
LAAVLYFVAVKFKKVPGAVLLVAVLALGCMSGINVVKIANSIQKVSAYQDFNNDDPNIVLSQKGKNVVVVMLDRAQGVFVPFIMEEKPELQAAFDGFTYYSNTFSFGEFTNFCVPALAGGYEYTPVEMNKRAEESLMDKHNEAIKVMPQIFSDNGYKVTVVNPTYANYQWIPDVSIYRDIENCNAYLSLQSVESTNYAAKNTVVESNTRNFFCFSLMKTMPLALQYTLYDGGQYLQIRGAIGTVGSEETVETTNQMIHSMTSASGISSLFQDGYNAMESLVDVTRISSSDTNTFLYFTNEVTHNPAMLQLPNYEPAENVDNSAYPELLGDRMSADGQVLMVNSESALVHYQTNMAALLQLGEWFDYLREQGVYDNTRIIVVSDHGQFGGRCREELILKVNGEDSSVAGNFPLLMVKDFGATGFHVSTEFMTNADVPTLATDEIIENPVNPYTGKPINSDEKTAHEQIAIVSTLWDVAENNGNTFKAAQWASVKDNIWDADNWSFYMDREVVLDEHKLPE